VSTGRLIAHGIDPRVACRSAISASLSDDPDLLATMDDLVAQTF
jgi:hypothetical protein